MVAALTFHAFWSSEIENGDLMVPDGDPKTEKGPHGDPGPHHGLVPELWSLSNITQRLVDQNKTSSLLYWKISSKISVGHLESLSSGQVSTSAIGNLAMKVSTSWRILGVTSPVHCLGHWQSISDSLPYLLESWSLKLNKPLRLSHIL